ncbi:MAG: type II toxin-antitoxin system RelE/ParE family toxin [Proteobacteria bacterium]|nr:type II toxin-antitoxin system RelE/ParE family toxin [Pseudomonadota bacterium]
MKVFWTRRALEDLGRIAGYVSKDNPAAAIKVIKSIRKKVANLADHPKSGRVGRVAGTRELVVSKFPYVVAYWIVKGEIEILAVFHGAQKWPKSL